MKATTDIWLASFLMLQGHTVSDFETIGKGKGKYFFKMSEDDWSSIKMDFHNSEVSKIKMNQISLKDLLY